MPPVFSILADTSPLSHLKVCPACEATRVSAATLCKGRQYPDHQDWWYETCLNNHRPTHKACNHFSWLEEIPKGRPTAPTLCPGTLCKELRAPKRINGDCTFGLCAPCCVDVRRVHPEVRSCAVSAHSKGVVAGVALVLDDDDQPDGATSSRTVGGTGQGHDTSGLVPARPATPSKQRSYAISISPIYQERLVALEHTDRRRVEAAEIEADYEQRQSRQVPVYWWGKNGEGASVFIVEPARWPFFHPKDCAQLVARFKTDTVAFQYFEWKLSAWVQGDPSSPVRNVKMAGELHYRTDGVDHAPGMPPHGLKRSLEDPEEYGRSCGPVMPGRHLSPMWVGASGWTRSSSALTTPSSSFRSTPGSVPPATPASESASSTPGSSTLMGSTPLQMPGPSSQINSEASIALDRLPALFPELVNLLTSSALSASPSSPGASLAPGSVSSELDLSPAPRSRFGWPLLYVCDMAAGFAAMRRLEDTGTARPVAFEQAFKHKFTSSTFSDNWRVWMASAHTPQLREAWIREGRTDMGLWKAFAKVVRASSN